MTNTMPFLHDTLCSEMAFHGIFKPEEKGMAVFSSIAASQALKTLKMHYVLDWGNPQTARLQSEMLKWAAFAVFSPYAMNSVDYFDFESNTFTLQDAAAIAEVVSAANPLQVLLNSSEEECRTSSLLEDVELHVDRHGISVKLRAGLSVWVVHNRSTESFMEVLVGHGVRRVKRTKLNPPVKPVPKTPVERMFLMVYDIDGDLAGFPGLLPILGAVGIDLTSLEVRVDSGVHKLSIMDIRMILRSCPNLVNFMIHGARVDSLDGFVEAYESNESRVRHLQFHAIEVTNTNGTDRFFDALESNNSVMSRHLLGFRVDDVNSSVQNVQNATRLAKVLNRNRVLQVFITYARDVGDDAPSRVLDEQLDKDVLVRCGPVPLRSKLAFLSAMTSSTYKAFEWIDSAIVSIIFGFASPGIKRVIQVVHR